MDTLSESLRPELERLKAQTSVITTKAEALEDAKNTRIAELEAQVESLMSGQRALGQCVHNMVAAEQAAWIEWKHGRGAEAAMTWIHNGLMGPGHIPDETAPYGKEAQAWYDANCADPLPVCHCGRPSNTAWMGHGFCSQEHYKQFRAQGVSND
ncbi:MAG: hypothetical protein LBE61_00265 [Burkholderiaceae bacterium]|jgi:hypothetical protein|nr:hypothetical protein [Burkholderiaceae bacterium]